MILPRSLRILIAMAIAVLGLAALLLFLTISEAMLTIRAQLGTQEIWVQTFFWGVLGLLGIVFGGLLWYLLRPSRNRSAKDAETTSPPVPTEQTLRESIEAAEALEVDRRGSERTGRTPAPSRGRGDPGRAVRRDLDRQIVAGQCPAAGCAGRERCPRRNDA